MSASSRPTPIPVSPSLVLCEFMDMWRLRVYDHDRHGLGSEGIADALLAAADASSMDPAFAEAPRWIAL